MNRSVKPGASIRCGPHDLSDTADDRLLLGVRLFKQATMAQVDAATRLLTRGCTPRPVMKTPACRVSGNGSSQIRQEVLCLRFPATVAAPEGLLKMYGHRPTQPIQNLANAAGLRARFRRRLTVPRAVHRKEIQLGRYSGILNVLVTQVVSAK
jgi:hypothetical protein